jgi:uncharacterized protein YndB with AHSA1/START domain
MTPTTETDVTTQVHRVYIRATPQAIWDAITKPEWTERYGYGGHSEFDLRPGGGYRWLTTGEMREMGAPEVGMDGEVVESDPPHRLVQTWRMLMEPGLAAEGFTRLTYEIREIKDGVTRLTVTHDLQGAPQTASLVAGAHEEQGAGGGWAWVLSGLKTLLETGESLPG